MTRSTWKSHERKVSRIYDKCCGKRVVLSGGNNINANTRSDAQTPCVDHLYLESKAGAFIPTWITKLWLKTSELATAENRIPVVVLHPKQWTQYLAIIDAVRHSDLENLAMLIKKISDGKTEPEAWDKAAELADKLTKRPE